MTYNKISQGKKKPSYRMKTIDTKGNRSGRSEDHLGNIAALAFTVTVGKVRIENIKLSRAMIKDEKKGREDGLQ